MEYGSTSDKEILEHYQYKVLRITVDASWWVPNTVIRRDRQTPAVKEEIRHYSSQYRARLGGHPNDLVVNLMAQQEIVKKPAKRSTIQIPSVIILFVV
jgi:hypothetical protein